MDLALGRARADRHPRRQVGDVLRDLDVEEFGGGRQPEIVDVEQQLAREPQALVDVEALVQVGVVDEPLPADRRARLLEVGAHDDDQVIGIARGETRQPFAIFERRGRVVDGTGSGDDDQPRVLALQRVGNRRPRCRDDVGRPFADRDLLVKDRRRDQRAHLPDAEIVGSLEHPGTNSSKCRQRRLPARRSRRLDTGPYCDSTGAQLDLTLQLGHRRHRLDSWIRQLDRVFGASDTGADVVNVEAGERTLQSSGPRTGR